MYKIEKENLRQSLRGEGSEKNVKGKTRLIHWELEKNWM